MTLYPVAKTSDFNDLDPVYTEAGDVRIGVYRFKGNYFAYVDVCPHQGGPACGGGVFAKVECEIKGGGKRIYDSTERFSIACPWHGVEFDLETGICIPRKDWRLASLETVVEGDQVMVRR